MKILADAQKSIEHFCSKLQKYSVEMAVEKTMPVQPPCLNLEIWKNKRVTVQHPYLR